MPSEKVISALAALGVEVPSDEFGHAGKKGMKWDRSKLSSESDIFDKTNKELEARNKAADKLFNDYKSGKVSAAETSRRLDAWKKHKPITTNTKPTNVEKARKFVSNLFDKKVKAQKVLFPAGTKRTAIQQGTVNKFIEGAFKKVTGQK